MIIKRMEAQAWAAAGRCWDLSGAALERGCARPVVSWRLHGWARVANLINDNAAEAFAWGEFTLRARSDGPVGVVCPVCADPKRCESCRGRGRVRRHGRDARAANGGAALIRQGRRLLAAAKGQPSECRVCNGNGGRWDDEEQTDHWFKCGDCRGTGHNLAGVLPGVDPSIAAVARARDGEVAAERLHGTQVAEWQVEVLTAHQRSRETPDREPLFTTVANDPATGERRTLIRSATRVVPRGEHRQSVPYRTEVVVAGLPACVRPCSRQAAPTGRLGHSTWSSHQHR